MEQDITNFLRELKNQSYLPQISYHYAKSLYEIIRDRNNNSQDPEIKILLMLVVLSEVTFSFGDICIQLENSGTENSNVCRLVARIYEKLVRNNFKFKKKFDAADKLKFSDEPDAFLENWFNSFWKPLLDFDKQYGTDGYLNVFRKFDSVCGVYNKSDNAVAGFHIPIVCFPADDSPCMYFSRYFNYETRVVELISKKITLNSGLVVNIYNSLTSYKDSGAHQIFNKLLTNDSFEGLVKDFLDILFPTPSENIKYQDQMLSELLADPSCSEIDYDNAAQNLYKFRNGKFSEEKISELKKDTKIIDWQKVAAATACLSDFTVITGGPGTGKTTTVAKILLLLNALSLVQNSEKNLRICLAAPTGKAANRMKESLENSNKGLKSMREAIANKISSHETILENLCMQNSCSTVHKLLGLLPSREIPEFKEDNHLPYDLLIVDEVSMMDLSLLTKLLKAVKPSCKLIFLGDQEQLPSVDEGAILSDICLAFKFDHLNSALNYRKKHQSLVNELIKMTGFRTLNLFTNEVSSTVSRLFRSYRFATAKAIGALAADINRSSLKGNLETLEYYEQLQNDDGKRSVNIINYHTDCINNSNNKQTKFNSIINQEDKIIDKLLHKFCNFSFLNEIDENDAEKYSYRPYLALVREIIGHPINRQPTNVIKNLAVETDIAKQLFTKFNMFRILCTNRDNKLGVESINKAIEKEVLKWFGESSNLKYFKNSTAAWGEHWYPGKPVIITKNNYHLELFNGDIGITLFAPNPENINTPEMKVLFQMPDGSFRYFSTAELVNYELAYALTVHKSQGSEFDHTVVVLPNYESSFVTRELLYTGITRAKSFVTIYGDEKAIAFYSQQINQRTSNLTKRLRMNNFS